MIPGNCLEIHTTKFPILPGENDEIVNEGMYGKALCTYLGEKLNALGLVCRPAVAEDWGWWQEVENNGFKMGLCIYSQANHGPDPDFYTKTCSENNGLRWSWSKFRKVDISSEVISIMDKVESVVRSDSEISYVNRQEERSH